MQVGDVISKSDYILVAAALTPETKGMVGAAELARVRRALAGEQSFSLEAGVLRLVQYIASFGLDPNSGGWAAGRNFGVYPACRRCFRLRKRRVWGRGK